MQDHKAKQLGRISMYAKCIGGCMQGDSAGSNPRLCLEKKGEMINLRCFFCLGHQGKKHSVGP